MSDYHVFGIIIPQIEADEDIYRMNMEIDRLAEKLKDVDDRIEDLEGEYIFWHLHTQYCHKLYIFF